MSDPFLVQFTFRINREMPKDMKTLILYLFTDYYEKYYPNKKPDFLTVVIPLYKKYPVILDMCRNDCYHNVEFKTCHLAISDVYDLDTEKYYNDDYTEIMNHTIGISIVSLPRSEKIIDDFLKTIEPYISSKNSTIGITTWDCGNLCYYYYYGKNGIMKQTLSPTKDDKLVCEYQQKELFHYMKLTNEERHELYTNTLKDIENCKDYFKLDEVEVVDICPKCGRAVDICGECICGCRQSPIVCDECFASPCNGTCNTNNSGEL